MQPHRSPSFEQLSLDGNALELATPDPAPTPAERLELEAIASGIARPTGRGVSGPYVGEYGGRWRVYYAGPAEPYLVGPAFSLDAAGGRLARAFCRILAS